MNFAEAQEKYINGDFLLKSQFQSANYTREETLNRAERYAGWTLPSIFPDDPLNEYDELQYDYQSLGAQAVNNLANKMMMALFPPARPFFRMDLTDEQKADIADGKELDDAQLTKVLAQQERAGMKVFNKRAGRVAMHDVMTNLIIVGNVCVYTPQNEKMQTYSLRDFTVLRDLRGNLVKGVIRETKAVEALSEELGAIAIAEGGYADEDEVELYTCIKRISKNRFIVWQELEDLCYCHKTVGLYTDKDIPWLFLTWKLARNKDYGTGLVEDYSGDFHMLSTLSEASIDFVTLLTDVKNLVNPTGMTNVREINEAPSGAYVHGREQDLFVHSPNVHSNAEFIDKKFVEVARRIAVAFLIQTAVTRQAERVTAEEIRQTAQELEGSLGGVYSRQADELQTPLATRIIAELDSAFKDIEPLIVTGLESLSRSSELDRLRAFFNDLVPLADLPERIADRIDFKSLIAVIGAGHGVDYDAFLLGEEMVKQKRKERAAREAQAAGLEAGAVTQATEGQQ